MAPVTCVSWLLGPTFSIMTRLQTILILSFIAALVVTFGILAWFWWQAGGPKTRKDWLTLGWLFLGAWLVFFLMWFFKED